MARIEIFIQFRKLVHQTSPHRIEVDVADQLKEVGILLNHDALVTVRGKVTFSTVSPVVPDGLAGHEPTHHGGQEHGTGTYKEVKVIGHKTPGAQLYLPLGHHLGKGPKESIAVPSVPEDVLPLDAPRQHIV